MSLCLRLIAVVSLFWLAMPAAAWACGGFFCSNAQPVNQSAERIIFAVHDDGTVTALVEIDYEGPSERFAWVLPVPTVPEVGVSSNFVFDTVQAATNPVFSLSVSVYGRCRGEGGGDDGGSDTGFPDTSSDSGGGGGGGSVVTVAASGSTGPYDWVVIELAQGNDDIAAAALVWLTANGYDVAESDPDLIRPYLLDGMRLIAFRLTKRATTGSIRPISLRYEASRPMIPIQLTAVAATEDMGVLVWVLGPHRAIPQNYLDVVLNPAAINWLSGAANYGDVVNRAVDEAGGQAFVTEMADRSSIVRFVPPISPMDIDTGWILALEAGATPELRRSLVVSLIRRLSGIDGLGEALEATVLASPDAGSAATLLACLNDAARVEGWEADAGPAIAAAEAECLPDAWLSDAVAIAFFEAARDEVVQPIEDAQALITEHAWITRFYTTLSPDEMIVDPVFAFNADLAGESRFHQATQVIHCDQYHYRRNAPWEVDLGSGLVARGNGSAWPTWNWSGLPAALLVRRFSEQGAEPELVTDNRARARTALDSGRTPDDGTPAEDAGDPRNADANTGEPVDVGDARQNDDHGCSAAHGHRAGLLGLVGLVAAVGRRRTWRNARA